MPDDVYYHNIYNSASEIFVKMDHNGMCMSASVPVSHHFGIMVVYSLCPIKINTKDSSSKQMLFSVLQ